MVETNATHDCKCWHEIDSAPRDGTVIEIKNSYGIAPYYGLYKWDGLCWQSERDPSITIMTGNHDLSWRAYSGSVSDYRDPTGGAQETPEYWQDAARRRPVLVQWPS